MSVALVGAVQSATARPAQAAGGLSCRYVVVAWQGGFTADLFIANNSGTTINGWTASWNFQHATLVTQTWGGAITQASPYDATGSNAPWNAVLSPGGSTMFGWNATAAVADIPSVVMVNGIPCPVNVSS